MNRENIRENRCRICPKCNGIMLQTMCLPYCEIVCVPCQYGEGMFNSLPKIYLSDKEHSMLRKLYDEDILKMAFEKGGATCAKCYKKNGNNCPNCTVNKEYKFKTKEKEDDN